VLPAKEKEGYIYKSLPAVVCNGLKRKLSGVIYNTLFIPTSRDLNKAHAMPK
jgi:hypothetical protein